MPDIITDIKKWGYGSPDQSIYDHHVKMDPEDKDLPVASTMKDAKAYLKSCLKKEAESAALAQLEEENSPDEKELIAAWKNKKEKGKAQRLGKIDDPKLRTWIAEKGDPISRELYKARTAVQLQKYRQLMEGDKSLNGISPNTDHRTVLDRQAEENAYVTQIIRGEKTADEVVDDVIREGKEKLPGLERKSAEEFIDDIRRGFRDGMFNAEDDDYPAKQFADIFAARILSNSVRNNRDSLAEDFIKGDLDEMSRKLLDNQDFRFFINETYLGSEDEGNQKLRDAEHRLYASRTHGGFIEDEFKKYLLKRPAGDLENSPELARFMPTAKERIEELKRQVKADPDNEVLQQAAAAEIIAIRNACGVERKNGYGLDKRIPAAPDGKRLADEARKLQQDVTCRIILRDESTRKDLLSRGHGGQMMANIRERYEKQIRPENRNPAADSVLKKNTIGRSMESLRAEAQEISGQLAGRNSKLRSEALARSMEVLGEYMALVDKARNGPGGDAPWKYVDARKNGVMKDPMAQKMMNSPEKASRIMKAIASGDVDVFQQKLRQGLDAVRAEAAAPKVSVSQQPGRIEEGYRGPQAPTL